MPRRAFAASTAAIVVLSALAGAVACGPQHVPARPSKTVLAPYEGRLAELFDDGFEAVAIGLPGERRALKSDELFRERAQGSDGIVRARVRTVSGEREGAYLLTLEPIERLGGKRAPTSEIALHLTRGSSAFGTVRARGEQLAGKTFIAFAREFAGADGAPAWHVHLDADAKDVEAAVKEAVALDELR